MLEAAVKDKQEMLALAEKTLQYSRQQGADAARVNLTRSRFINIDIRNGKLEKAASSINQSLRLTLFINGRYGVHNTNDFAAAPAFVQRACDLTKLLTPDPWRAMPDINRMADNQDNDLQIYDQRLAALPLASWLNLAKTIDDSCQKVGKDTELVSSQGGAYLNVDRQLLADSRGLACYRIGASGFALAGLVVMDNTDKLQTGKRRNGFWYCGTCQIDAINQPDMPQLLAANAKNRAISQLGAHPGPSGDFPVLVENQASAHLLHYLLKTLQGYNLKQKNSYLQDSLYKSIASPQLTIIDRPLMPGGFGSSWFDSEGVARSDLTIIEQGVLQNFLLDTYHSRALNLPASTDSITNLTVAPSAPKNQEQLMTAIENGLLLTSFLGGNFNSTTGDFSLGLNGHWIEKGKIAYPVNSMNMFGNFKQMWHSLHAVGNDPFPYSATLSPSLLFDKISLSGK
jgi:PmbA protein